MKLHTYALYDLAGTMMCNSAKNYVCHYFCYANPWNVNHTRPHDLQHAIVITHIQGNSD